MSNSQSLIDADFSNLSPNYIQYTNVAQVVAAQSSLGSWSVDMGNVAVASPQYPLIAPYNGSLGNDSQRNIVSLAKGVAGAISQQVDLPRAGIVILGAMLLRKPSAGPNGGAIMGMDIVRDRSACFSTQLSSAGVAVTMTTQRMWILRQQKFPIGHSGTAYVRFIGGADAAGLDNGGMLITSAFLFYPYNPVGRLTSASGGSVGTAANQPFPEMRFSFTETNPPGNDPANANNSLPNSNVTFQLKSGQSGIRFASANSYATTTDGDGNARIPAGTLTAGPNGGASDQLVAYMGSESAGVVASLSVTGQGTLPPPTTGDTFVWFGAENPLQMTQNGTANAIFQLQTNAGQPVPRTPVLLSTGNPNGTNLLFVGGNHLYDGTTDDNGMIMAQMTAGSVVGTADVLAILISNGNVNTKVDVQINQATAPQQKYQLVWAGGTNPLPIATGATAPAVFQLQVKGTGAPVPGVAVYLSIENLGAAELEFAAGGESYDGTTDPSGNISAAMSAGQVPGEAFVTATLDSDPSVSSVADIQIGQATPPTTLKYTLSWANRSGTLQIPQHQQASAGFLLQTLDTAEAAKGQLVALELTGNLGLTFVNNGMTKYAAYTDQSGTITAKVQAGDGAGTASLNASMPSNEATPVQAPITVTALRLADDAAMASASKTGENDPGL